MATGKKVFFHEKLNLAGLSKRNKPKQDEAGKYLTQAQVANSTSKLALSTLRGLEKPALYA